MKVETVKTSKRTATMISKGSSSSKSTTSAEKKQELKEEKAKAKLFNPKDYAKRDQRVFLSGQESGTLGWLEPLFCKFFKIHAAAYRKNVTMWTFPPSLEGNSRKRHTVIRQFLYRKDGKFILFDVFDDDVKPDQIKLFKAWFEKMGYLYTYIVGGEQPGDKADDVENFAKLIFSERLKMIDPKKPGYPKFKIPTTYREAGLPFGN